MVTRRFWPLVGGTERVMSQLAESLQAYAVQPTIVTAQWEAHWPTETAQLVVPVVRLPRPPMVGWGTIRYLWSLSRWLRTAKTQFDAVLISSLKEEAFTALTTLQSSWQTAGVPIVLRAEQGGTHGDCHWQATAPFGSRIRARCQSAPAIIAPSPLIASELIAAGYAKERITTILNGVPLSAPRTAASRQEARASLSELHGDLSTEPSTPVAVYVGHLHKDKGLHDLVRAWRKIVEVWSDARLWLIGDGPERSDLYHRIRDCNLQYHIFMPGAFDDVTEFLHAADVFVAPQLEAGTSLGLLEAFALELPVIASDIEPHRWLCGENERGWLVRKRQPLELAEAIARVFTLQEEATARAKAGRNFAEEHHSSQAMAQQHYELIASLIGRST
jgi:glycosyltransferase involved in cell wall biosynthesis